MTVKAPATTTCAAERHRYRSRPAGASTAIGCSIAKSDAWVDNTGRHQRQRSLRRDSISMPPQLIKHARPALASISGGAERQSWKPEPRRYDGDKQEREQAAAPYRLPSINSGQRWHRQRRTHDQNPTAMTDDCRFSGTVEIVARRQQPDRQYGGDKP